MGSNGSAFSTPSGNQIAGINVKDTETSYELAADKMEQAIESMCFSFDRVLFGIGECWASPEAVKYSEKISGEFNNIIVKTRNKFVRIINEIKTATENWYTTTGYQGHLRNFEAKIDSKVRLTQPKAKEIINGIVGVDKWVLESNAAFFEREYVENIESHCEGIKINVRKLGFLGAGQMAALTASVDVILSEIVSKLRTVASEMKMFAKNIAIKYEDTGERISQTFRAMQN